MRIDSGIENKLIEKIGGGIHSLGNFHAIISQNAPDVVVATSPPAESLSQISPSQSLRDGNSSPDNDAT
jgi:hypothetical protein